VFSRNADVRPTFLVDGFVAGTWDLRRTDGAARIELRPFARLPRQTRDAVAAEADRVLSLVEPSARREVAFDR
jgi:hypothetical protein